MKSILTTMLCVAGMVNVLACDVCGGAGAMSGLGFLPNSDYHFIGLTYRARTYSTEHPKLFASEATVSGTNTFHTAEVWGRYQLNSRTQLMAFLPVHIKNITDTENTYDINGLGDASLLANYVIVKKTNLRWFVGGGVKLPTGKSNVEVNNQVVPNLQTGSGSIDGLFTTNLTYLKGNWGLNTETNITITTTNKNDYKYGNQADASIAFLHKQKKGKVMYVPQLGVNYTKTKKDVSSVKNDITEKYSGADVVSIPIGLDLYRGSLGLRLNCKIPLLSTVSEGYVIPKVNAQAQLIFIINKKEKTQ
jgi:hypothetical protein